MTDFAPDVEKSLEVLRSGGVILYPTDTIWGLGCDATDSKAIERIYQLKQRPEAKRFVVLLADERDILRYITNPDPRVFDYLKTVQKPTTIIYRDAIGLSDKLISPDGTVAIRIIHEPFCRHLVKRLRKPLVSTSANLSGHPPPSCFADIPHVIKSGVDYVVQYRQNENTTGEPSAMVTWAKDGTFTMLRK